jgi:ribose transport system permease protein
MLILPAGGGTIPGWWVGFSHDTFLGLSNPVWMLIALILFRARFGATRLGITIQATGFCKKSAFLSGVPVTRINILTCGLSGLFAAAAALYLTTQTSAGPPTIGKDYMMPAVAAAVIGAVSLFGGRGHLLGAIVGTFILTLIGNIVFVLGVLSHWQPVMSGAILLVAVLAGSMAEKSAKGPDE